MSGTDRIVPKGPAARAWLVCLALLALAGSIYIRTAWHGWVDYDDHMYGPANPSVASGLSAGGIRWAFTTTRGANWHPLTWLSHMADAELFGDWAGGSHLMSAAIHGANGILLFLLLLRVTGDFGRSGIVAALFVVHPHHVESVAWLSERKDVLCGMFWMLATLSYLRFTDRPAPRRIVPVVLLFLAALLAKPMAVTLPFTLLLLDAWPLRRLDGGIGGEGTRPGTTMRAACALVREKTPLFFLSATFSVIAYAVQSRAGVTLERLSLPERVGNAVISYGTYLGRIFWPSGLAVFYPHPGHDVSWTAALFCGVLLVSLSAVAWSWRHTRPYLAFGWLWFLGTLVPVIGLVQAGEQAMADRYAYLPSIGIYVAAVWGVWEAAAISRAAGKAARIVAALSVILLAFVSARQASYWKDSETLFSRAATVTKGNWLARNTLGVVLERRGKVPEAIEQYREALRIRPDYPEAWNHLGNALRRQGDLEGAEAHYLEALRFWPGRAEIHANLGLVRLERGDTESGLGHLREAVRLAPGDPRFRERIGEVLLKEGRLEEAVSHLQEAVRLMPGNLAAREMLRRALAGRGR